MRTLCLAVLLCAFGSPALADAPAAPLGHWVPPEGRFFDDPIAVSADGKLVAAVSTDAATSSTLHYLPVGEPGLVAAGLPPTVRAIHFLTPERLLVVVKHGDGDRVVGMLATVRKNGATKTLGFDKKQLGPADAIDVVDRDGKRLVTLYSKSTKKTVEHSVQILAADTLRPIARRSFVESAEGAMRTKAGEVRPLWWSRGHTSLNVQKIGEYDKTRDIRRPDRFVRIDLVTDKLADEHEIEDVLGFASASIVRKSAPPEDAFARLSEDHKEVLLLDGTDERPLPLSRDIHLYDVDSLRSIEAEQTLYVGFQVEPGNIVAVGRREQDPDDFDLYAVDRTSMHGKSVMVSRRVLMLPGAGRRIGFQVGGGNVAILRKDKGFDRGGVAIDLYPAR